ncbi:MAG: hypothetical protein H0X33_03845 [Taibaiella sp.]|nr:hypothetical protein [Taibaiella sp.]
MKPFQVILLAGCTMLASCGKTNTGDVAGKGGNSQVTLTIQHHASQKNIYYAKVFVKYNATDLPANGVYDDSVLCTHVFPADTSLTAIFTSLKNGNYVFFADGKDSLFKEKVKGLLPYALASQKNDTTTLYVDEYGPL